VRAARAGRSAPAVMVCDPHPMYWMSLSGIGRSGATDCEGMRGSVYWASLYRLPPRQVVPVTAGPPPAGADGSPSIQHADVMRLGRYEAYEALCAESVEQGDDLTTKTLAGWIAMVAAALGHRSTAHRYLGVLRDVLRRWDLPLTPDTAGYGDGTALALAILEGRLADARELAHPALTGAQTEFAVHAAAVTVHVGMLMDDEELLSVPARWVDHEVRAGVRLPLAGLRLYLAQHAGDRNAAAAHATQAWTAASTAC
jgi:hypothetical protein